MAAAHIRRVAAALVGETVARCSPQSTDTTGARNNIFIRIYDAINDHDEIENPEATTGVENLSSNDPNCARNRWTFIAVRLSKIVSKN